MLSAATRSRSCDQNWQK